MARPAPDSGIPENLDHSPRRSGDRAKDMAQLDKVGRLTTNFVQSRIAVRPAPATSLVEATEEAE